MRPADVKELCKIPVKFTWKYTSIAGEVLCCQGKTFDGVGVRGDEGEVGLVLKDAVQDSRHGGAVDISSTEDNTHSVSGKQPTAQEG